MQLHWAFIIRSINQQKFFNMWTNYKFITKREKIEQLKRMCKSEYYVFCITHDAHPNINIVEVQISGVPNQAFYEFIHRLGFLGI